KATTMPGGAPELVVPTSRLNRVGPVLLAPDLMRIHSLPLWKYPDSVDPVRTRRRRPVVWLVATCAVPSGKTIKYFSISKLDRCTPTGPGEPIVRSGAPTRS